MTNAKPNPYVGPRAFQIDETLYGRERELRQLKSLLVAERIVLLHSPSGAGKTSLINAGLIPAMRKSFNMLPVIRVNLEPPLELQSVEGFNRYTFSTLASLEEAHPLEQRLPNAVLAALSLDAYLAQRAAPGDLLLIFDQFEEILTSSPADREARAAFFAGLGAALRNDDRWALFSMREDFIGALDPYLRPLPGQLESRYRLDLLGAEAARQAVQKPARAEGVEFSDEAAQKLVDDLRVIQVQKLDGTTESIPGLYVEPVQLQVICYNLWETGAAEDGRIGTDDLQRIGSINQSLSAYYANRVQRASESGRVDERLVRLWFEQTLITPEGVRNQVLRTQAFNAAGITEMALSQLESAHLIRSETRAGKIWVELAHDRLVEPVRQSNVAWFEMNLSLLQKRSALWEKQGHSDGLLLRGKEFKEAEQQAKSQELTQVERGYLETSRSLYKREQRERRRNTLMTILAIGATIALIAAILLWRSAQDSAAKAIDAQATAEANAMDAMVQKIKADQLLIIAEEKTKNSRAGELAAQAVTLHDSDLFLSSLLGIEAFRSYDTIQTRKILLSNLVTYPQVFQFIPNENYLRGIAISPDGKKLAAGTCDSYMICNAGEVTLWNLPDRQIIGKLRTDTEENGTYSLAFSPDGKILAVGSYTNITLWDIVTQKAIGQTPVINQGGINNLIFSKDGTRVLSGSGDGSITLWDTSSQQSIGKFSGGNTNIYSLALSPDGQTLASISSDQSITLWDVNTQKRISQLIGGFSPVCCLAYSPDGRLLAAGEKDDKGNFTILWDVASQLPYGKPIPGLYAAFSNDGKTLATSNREEKTVTLWNASTQESISEPFKVPGAYKLLFSMDGNSLIAAYSDENISSIAVLDLLPRQPASRFLAKNLPFIRDLTFSPDDKTLAFAGYDQAGLLDVETGKPIGQPIIGHSGPVVSVVFNSDGSMLATGGEDKSILLWNVADHKSIGQPLIGHAGPVVSLAFSPDGKMLASESLDASSTSVITGKTVIVWDLATGKPVGQNTISPGDVLVNYLAFSPDGKTLATINGDTIVIFDLTEYKLTARTSPSVYSYIQNITFGLEGKTLLSLDGRNNIIVWDMKTLLPINTKLPKPDMYGGGGQLFSGAFSHDGNFAVDFHMTLWDVKTNQPVGRLPSVINLVSGNAMSSNGNLLAGVDSDATSIILVNLTPSSWVEETCQRIGRNLTRAEWMQYFPDEPYTATCAQWPLEPEPTATSTP